MQFSIENIAIINLIGFFAGSITTCLILRSSLLMSKWHESEANHYRQMFMAEVREAGSLRGRLVEQHNTILKIDTENIELKKKNETVRSLIDALETKIKKLIERPRGKGGRFLPCNGGKIKP